MPAGMLLRSRRRSSHIADPRQALTIGAYERACRLRVSDPTITLEEFVDYGRWFQRTAVPDVDRRRVTAVGRDGAAFVVQVDGGEEIAASRVIVAAGLSPFMDRPEPFARLPAAVCSHSYEHADLGVFAGLRTAVIGSGQSALESAALLHEAGAAVEVLARAPAIRWLGELERRGGRWPRAPPDGRGDGSSDGCRRTLERLDRRGARGVPRPSRVASPDDLVSLHPARGRRLAAAAARRRADLVRPLGARRPRRTANAVKLSLSDGSTREVDRVLLGTGFKIDVRRYPFLTPELVSRHPVGRRLSGARARPRVVDPRTAFRRRAGGVFVRARDAVRGRLVVRGAGDRAPGGRSPAAPGQLRVPAEARVTRTRLRPLPRRHRRRGRSAASPRLLAHESDRAHRPRRGQGRSSAGVPRRS